MTNFFKSFITDENGASAAEYALILAIVGAGIAGAAFFLGNTINQSLRGTAGVIANCSGSNASGC